MTGCQKPVDTKPYQNKIDSLTVSLQRVTFVRDSLQTKLTQQRILIRFTAEKCHRYATIVKNKPTQSIFIVNWIDRSFLWVNER